MAHQVKISDLVGEVVKSLASSSGGNGYKELQVVTILTKYGNFEQTYFRIEGKNNGKPYSYRADTAEEAVSVYNNDGRV